MHFDGTATLRINSFFNFYSSFSFYHISLCAKTLIQTIQTTKIIQKLRTLTKIDVKMNNIKIKTIHILIIPKQFMQ